LGIPLPPDQLYQGTSLYSANAQADRKIYLNSFEQYAVVEGHRLLQGDRENDATASITNSAFKLFGITNDGPRTGFPEIKSAIIPSPHFSQFDAFQENLLLNYSHYSQMIHSSPPTGK